MDPHNHNGNRKATFDMGDTSSASIAAGVSSEILGAANKESAGPSSTAKTDSSGKNTATNSKGKKRRNHRARRKKARDMPRRPLSSYNYFFRDERARWLAEREGGPKNNLSGGDLFSAMGKAIADRWKILSPEEAEKYKAMAATDMDRYRRDMDEYKAEASRKARLETVEGGATGSSVQHLYPTPFHIPTTTAFAPINHGQSEVPPAALFSGAVATNLLANGSATVGGSSSSAAPAQLASLGSESTNVQMDPIFLLFLQQLMGGEAQSQQQQQQQLEQPHSLFAGTSEQHHQMGAPLSVHTSNPCPLASNATTQQFLLAQQQQQHQTQQFLAATTFLPNPCMTNMNSIGGGGGGGGDTSTFPDLLALQQQQPQNASYHLTNAFNSQEDHVLQAKAQLLESYLAAQTLHQQSWALPVGNQNYDGRNNLNIGLQLPMRTTQQPQLTSSMISLLGGTLPGAPAPTTGSNPHVGHAVSNSNTSSNAGAVSSASPATGIGMTSFGNLELMMEQLIQLQQQLDQGGTAELQKPNQYQ